MSENQIAGIILIVFGGLQAARPDVFMRFQIWIQKKIMGADYIPSLRTYRIVRSLGVGILILGFLVITGAIE